MKVNYVSLLLAALNFNTVGAKSWHLNETIERTKAVIESNRTTTAYRLSECIKVVHQQQIWCFKMKRTDILLCQLSVILQ